MKTKLTLERELFKTKTEVDYWESQKRKYEKKLKSILVHLRYSKDDLSHVENELKKLKEKE